MENLSFETVSMDIIKPETPTPPSLRRCNLSLIDQMAPPTYTPVIYFYHKSENDDQSQDKVHQLKASLAQILTRFNLLAGTMADRFFVDCNDHGVEFSEVKVDSELSLVLKNPEIEVLHRLLPLIFTSKHTDSGIGREFLLSVQFNRFICGGVAIAVCISHKLADGTSIATFVNAWASATKGDAEFSMDLNFSGAKLFPARKIPGFKRGIEPSKEKIVTKRLVFDKSKIAALKEAATGGDSAIKPPSRVVAVSAFIWRRFMAIARLKPLKAKLFGALYPVDLRVRMDPPLPEDSFGNISWFITATSPIEIEEDLPTLVAKIRTAIQEIDPEFVKKLEDAEKLLELIQEFDEQRATGEVQFWSFTSWCRFPVYEADFGWGKPTWVCSPSRPFRNAVVLMAASDGHGIEAWVNLQEEDMTIFEEDEELLSFCLV